MSSSSASLLPRSLVVACFVSGKMAAMIMFNKDDGYAEAVVRGYKTQGAGERYSQTSFFLSSIPQVHRINLAYAALSC
jgi:hypothetical protein